VPDFDIKATSLKNRIIIAVSALLVVTLHTVTAFRDRSRTIDGRTAQNLIEHGIVTDAVVDGPYLYFQSGGERYKVPTGAVDMQKVYENTAVTIKEPNPYVADIVTILVLALLVAYLLRLARKNREAREQQLSEQIQLASELQKPADIRPIISDVTFSDVA